MVNHRLRWLGIFAFPALLALCAIASPAYAGNYSCDGGSNPVPSTVSGAVLIDLNSEHCVIDHDVTASGPIIINSVAFSGAGNVTTKKLTSTNGDVVVKAQNNSISTEEIKSGWNVHLEADHIHVDGSITGHGNQTIQPSLPTYHGSILIRSLNEVKVDGDVRIDGGLGYGSVKTGGIQIDANLSGTSTEFVIGQSSANGVSGSILANTSIGQSNVSNEFEGGIRVVNGSSGSTGGIRVISMTNLQAKATSSRAGVVSLDAQNGTLTLPSGKLDLEGATGEMGGLVFLAANTLSVADGTIISTAQDSTAADSYHSIIVAVTKIEYRGTDGLKLIADGNGLESVKSIVIGPRFSAYSSSNNSLSGLAWLINYGYNDNAELTIDGTGGTNDTAPLLLRSDGNNSSISITGYPIVTRGGDVTIQTHGATNHDIDLGFFGAFSDSAGIAIENDGEFKIDADGKDGNGGRIRIRADQAEITALDFIVTASGPSSGDGDSGRITWETKTFALGPNTKASLQANGATNGVGNAIYGEEFSTILFEPGEGEVTLGMEEGQLNLSARGGASSGNGGKITFKDLPSAVIVHGAVVNSPVIDVSVPGTEGDGGVLSITTADSLTFTTDDSRLTANAGSVSGVGGTIQISAASLNVNGTNARILANGRDTGHGGKIVVKISGDFAIANGVGTVSFEARNVDLLDDNFNGNADGGAIELESGGSLDIYAQALSVDGGQKGGTIKAKGENVIVSGNFTANGGANGDGGLISIDANSLSLPAEENTRLEASGFGTGNGGEISLKAKGQPIIVGEGNAEVSLVAKSNDSGDGGKVTLESDSNIELNGLAIDVGAGQNSNKTGGLIRITTEGNITNTGTLNARGGCDLGEGGSVHLKGNDVTTDGIDISGGDGTCLAIASRKTDGSSSRAFAEENEHDIVIEAANAWLYKTPLKPLKATAAASNGDGGSIRIENVLPIDLSTVGTDFLEAKGYDQGKGGSISIKNVLKILNPNPSDIMFPYAPLDILNIANTKAGENNTGLGKRGGTITVNEKTCQQYIKALSSWPRTVWDCTQQGDNPGASANLLFAIAEASPFNSVRSQLQNSELFVFSNGGDYSEFFRDNIGDAAGGLSYKSASGNHLYATAWESGSIGGNLPVTYSSGQYEEVAAHELGHIVDVSYSSMASKLTLYGTYVAHDVDTLDYDSGNLRDPCVTPVGGPKAPFLDIKDEKSGAMVCLNGALNPAVLGAPWPSNTLNSTVLYQIENSIFGPRAEIHAQAFSYTGFSAKGARPMTDQLFANGYFPCVRAWAASEQTGSGALPTAACVLNP